MFDVGRHLILLEVRVHGACLHVILSVLRAVSQRRAYGTPVTHGGRVALLGREADIQQAEIFHALLAQRRAELCDLLDEHAIKLARAEWSHDTAVVRRKRLRIKEIGAEVRDIDRMMLRLRGRLLGYDKNTGLSG